MSSNFNCSYMTMSRLTNILGFSEKFFFQPIYTNQAYFDKKITFKSSPLKPLNQFKENLAGVVPIQYCVPTAPFKMAAVTKNRNFFSCQFPLLLQIEMNSNFNCSYIAMSFSVRFFQPVYSIQEYYEIKIASKYFAQKFELK